MKKTKEQKEKQQNARNEARPKKVMELYGWTILVDERNYIIRKDSRTYYFSTLASALLDISDDLEKSLVKEDLQATAERLQKGRKEFLKAISTSVASLERE